MKMTEKNIYPVHRQINIIKKLCAIHQRIEILSGKSDSQDLNLTMLTNFSHIHLVILIRSFEYSSIKTEKEIVL